MKNKLNNVRAVVLDLDGTICLGNQLIPGANDLITLLHKQNKEIFFVTNSSTITRDSVYKKLINLGVQHVELNKVMNSTYAMAEYLMTNNYTQVYCTGTNQFIDEIYNMGIDTNSNVPEAIVIGYDPEFNFKKLEGAIKVYRPDCKIFAVNMDRTFPRDNGIITPGAGVIVAAFEHAVNRKIDLIVGKPSSLMLDLVLKDFIFKPEEILVVGDVYETDIIMASRYGALSVLIDNNADSSFDNYIVVNDLFDLIQIMKEYKYND